MINGRLLREYDNSRHQNPAAVIQNVSIGDPLGNFLPGVCNGMIDTGADRSVIPLRICETLKLKTFSNEDAYGFDRKMVSLPTYWVCLKVEGIGDILTFKAFGVDRKSILLGRDFLKNMLLVVSSKTSAYAISGDTQWKTLCLKLIRAL